MAEPRHQQHRSPTERARRRVAHEPSRPPLCVRPPRLVAMDAEQEERAVEAVAALLRRTLVAGPEQRTDGP